MKSKPSKPKSKPSFVLIARVIEESKPGLVYFLKYIKSYSYIFFSSFLLLSDLDNRGGKLNQFTFWFKILKYNKLQMENRFTLVYFGCYSLKLYI